MAPRDRIVSTASELVAPSTRSLSGPCLESAGAYGPAMNASAQGPSVPRTGLVSERQAVRMLARRSITPRHARRAIHAGLVGEPIQSAVANLYDAERVQELLAWPEVMA